MKSFHVIFSNIDDISHKRVIAIISFIVLIVLAFMSAYGHNVNENFIWVFASLTGCESLLTVIEKIKRR